jgi:DNA invertase Pin-like site-specific DNA recombinase
MLPTRKHAEKTEARKAAKIVVRAVQETIISRTPSCVPPHPLSFASSHLREQFVNPFRQSTSKYLHYVMSSCTINTTDMYEGAQTKMKIGYMRISRGEQTTALQEDALANAHCDKIFRDVMSGAKDERPQFVEMLKFARPADTIVVWRLDRLGRSLRNLIETVMDFQARAINFLSLTESIDTSTPGGKFTFHLFGALAEMERDIIRQRTKAGLDAARARGRTGGRPKAKDTIDPKKLKRAKELYESKTMTVPDIMKLTGFKSKDTFYKYVVNADGE